MFLVDNLPTNYTNKKEVNDNSILNKYIETKDIDIPSDTEDKSSKQTSAH